ncbi:MAG: efflux transporter outer membrane subunit [Cardiobacteriaceae bacterium]|nr:efflux transporter outer membrane subunit [Cardiobacteriaceae bacterium]
MPRKPLSLFILTLLLSACTTLPTGNLQQDINSSTDIPQEWMFLPTKTTTNTHAQWWRDYDNSELNHLIEVALTQNQNLAAAGYAWQKSRLAVDNSIQNQLPSYSGSVAANLNRNLNDGNAHTGQNYSTSLGLNYQMDLWGKLALNTDSARWEREASAEDLLATRLSLIGDIISQYLQIAYLNDQLALNSAYRDNATQIINITQAKHNAGSVSRLETREAEQNLTVLDTNRDNLLNQRKQSEVALAVLLGGAPKTLAIENASLNRITLPNIDSAIPARLLAQRPDLRAAQYRLQQNLNQISIAERDFYPDFNLGANIGTNASRLLEILQNPVAALSANLSLPFLDYHKKDIARQEAKISYQQALSNFRQTLYKAFGEVQSAIYSLNAAQTEYQYLQERLTQAKDIESLTHTRYEAGAESLQNWLERQNTSRNIEESLLTNRYQQLSRSLALHLALGGSLQDNDQARPQSNLQK